MADAKLINLDWVPRSFRGRTSFLAASGHRGAPSLPGLPTQEIADKSFGGFDAMLPQQATQLQHLLVAADGRLGSVLANRWAARLSGGAPAAAAAAAAAGGASVAEAAVVREVDKIFARGASSSGAGGGAAAEAVAEVGELPSGGSAPGASRPPAPPPSVARTPAAEDDGCWPDSRAAAAAIAEAWSSG
eukprot:CAMPEP_0177485658 /NCGR_PEP_ID=MMETSP0369-20130122/28675_1 /TAXON_ID=447022 ORGANISM="Scrippsiella hangoei-like, Strain SHHI-4" /NCGR_SAMPLE_ID=MMETSP0369 /ASSEMBLY_ACC=CAM_ASM_000364 /LENGTH=188 /DNA_ID=CAMNT_0018961845 /DNA_START=137 /DNA_END=702 /DNA_ORIENTATION=+